MMYSRILLISLVLSSSMFTDGVDKDNINRVSHDERRFRSSKVQQLWEKAEKMNLPTVSMSELYMDLKEHDHHVMEVKMLQGEGKDKDGIKQGLLRDEFLAIMHKYEIGGFGRDPVLNPEFNAKKGRFQDPKLNKLWKDVITDGKFTPKEFDRLFLEFKHHEDKLLELRNLQLEITRLKEISKNSAEQFTEEQLNTKLAAMRNLHSDVDDSYQRLRLILRKGKGDSFAPFEEPRVMELWELLERGEFSEEEKRSFMEELQHFEKRIEKQRHFREQLRNSAEKIDFHGGKDDSPPERMAAYHKLQDKLGDMTSKIEKIYSTLKSRLRRGVFRHNEL